MMTAVIQAAHRLARAHGHLWALELSESVAVIQARGGGIAAAVRTLIGSDDVGIYEPTLEGGDVHHETGSRRLRWTVSATGVEIVVSRPAGPCLRAVLLHDGQIETVGVGPEPARARHVAALARCVGALRETLTVDSECALETAEAVERARLGEPEIIAESHVDHLDAWSLRRALDILVESAEWAARVEGEVSVITIRLPESYAELECALHGPAVGGEPVPESEVHYARRPGRGVESRLVDRASTWTRDVTLVCGPHDVTAWVLYTVYPGPEAPREVADYPDGAAPDAVLAFWRDHALSAARR